MKKGEITLNELLTEDKYKNLSPEELSDVINNNLLFSDYEKLKGFVSDDKSKVLLEQWNK